MAANDAPHECDGRGREPVASRPRRRPRATLAASTTRWSVRRSFSLSTRGHRTEPWDALDAVALQPGVELKPGETQERRGARLVTMRASEHLEDRPLFLRG